MDSDAIENLFNCVKQKTNFDCEKQNGEHLSFLLRKDIDVFGQFYPIDISATVSVSEDKVTLLTHLTDGYSGDRSYLISELLMRANIHLEEASFGTWNDNGDIVIKKVVRNLKKLSCRVLISHINYCVDVYIATRPKLDLYATNWGLHYITCDELDRITRDLAWQIEGIERDLLS